MKIGFVGLGIMGESMCENIISKHDDIVFVYDCVREKVDLLKSKGGVACDSLFDLACFSDVIITMLPTSADCESVYTELLSFLDESKVCIDMSTIDPVVSVRIADLVHSCGAFFLDAPVVKSKSAAISGQLGIYVGGSFVVFNTVKSILSYMGCNVKYMGENGKGLIMKICHNALVAQIQNAVNETIVLAEKNGIGILDYTEAISYGGGQNFYLDTKYSFIANCDFTTAFSVENMAKDLSICSRLADDSAINLPGVLIAKNIYDKALVQGYAKEDFCATYKIVKEGACLNA